MTPFTDEDRELALAVALADAEKTLGLDIGAHTIPFRMRAARIVQHAESTYRLPLRLYKLAYFIMRNPVASGGATG